VAAIWKVFSKNLLLMTEKKRKLIFLWNYLEWGGAQIYFLSIMKLAVPSWDVVAILPKQSKPEVFLLLKNHGIRYEFLEFHLEPAAASTLKAKLIRQFRRIRSEVEVFRHLKKFDLSSSILHIETAPWQSWILITALALRRSNTFVTLHNFKPAPPPWRRFIWRTRFRLVSSLRGFNIFASNVDTKTNLKPWVNEVFWDRIKVTYTSVDTDLTESILASNIDRLALKRQFGIQEDKFVVLAVGQFIDRKGRWVFLDALEKLRKETDDIVFVWLMPSLPNDRDNLRIGKYHFGEHFSSVLSENVGTNRSDVLSFFLIADVFALPSFIEGLPIALLESMALGIPSISTNVYAIPEAIKDEETGMLIEAGNSEKLAQTVLRLYSDRDLRESIGKGGREIVRRQFDERDSARIALTAYSDCFENDR
jgi:glycosyltransferase involved in cell wall biosynthesis